MAFEICLDLSRHCVATEIKRLYEQAIRQALKWREEGPELEERIEALRRVQENIDLQGLRGRIPALAGGTEADVQLAVDNQEQARFLVDGEEVAVFGL